MQAILEFNTAVLNTACVWLLENISVQWSSFARGSAFDRSFAAFRQRASS